MNQSFYGSICITDILDALKNKHSAFSKGKNGKIYMNATVWLNEQVDDFGNIMSAQCNPAKDSKDQKFYIGNFKKSNNTPKPVSDKDIAGIDTDFDLPTSGNKATEKTFTNAADDLPF